MHYDYLTEEMPVDERDMFLEEILAEFGSEEKQSKPEPQKKRPMEESFASEKNPIL